ncbi:MAG: hypothetical protein AB8G22_23865 [Saprospiraceae bacterium]
MFRISLTIILFSLFQSLAFSQLNLHAGYNGAYFNPEITNQILADFDINNPEWDNPLGDINFASGVMAGVNYRMNSFGIEFNWYNQSTNPKASGIVNEKELFQNLFIRNNSYGVAVQAYISDAISIGVGGEYQSFAVKSEKTGLTQRFKVLREDAFAGRAFLDIAVAKGAISAFHIRPYVQLPFQEINVFALEQELNPDSANNANIDNYNEQLINFGISLYFSNGEQY